MSAINTEDARPDPALTARAVNDTFVNALLAVLSANIRFALSASWNEVIGASEERPDVVIARTYAYPVALSIVPSTQRPALSAWRQRMRYVRHGKRDHRTLGMGLRFYMDDVPLAHMERRWPLLNEVFEVIVDTLVGRTVLDFSVAGEVGRFPSTHLLYLAGLVTVREESIEGRVDFATASEGKVGFAIPFLDVAFECEVVAPSGPFSQDVDALDALTGMSIALVDARPPRELGTHGDGRDDGHRTLVELILKTERT